MKLFLAVILLSFIFSSCSSIYFIEPQPKGGERESEMPKELYGLWFGENEGWQFNENGITAINFEIDSIENIVDTTYQLLPLSDTFRIYKAKELYVINLINSEKNNNYWEIVIFERVTNGDINIYYPYKPEIFAHVKGLKLEEATYYIDGEKKIVKTLTPDFESPNEFNNAVFSGQMTIKTLRKLITKIPPIIFKKDGSISYPVETIQED